MSYKRNIESICSNCKEDTYRKEYSRVGVFWYHSDNGMYANEECKKKKVEIDVSIDFDIIEELESL